MSKVRFRLMAFEKRFHDQVMLSGPALLMYVRGKPSQVNERLKNTVHAVIRQSLLRGHKAP